VRSCVCRRPLQRQCSGSYSEEEASDGSSGVSSKLGPYIVDFYCSYAALVVEVDGSHHFTPDGVAYDDERTAYLAARGLRVLRFTNAEVLRNEEAVTISIKRALSLTPGPSSERGEG
jgi:hypothetical protein